MEKMADELDDAERKRYSAAHGGRDPRSSYWSGARGSLASASTSRGSTQPKRQSGFAGAVFGALHLHKSSQESMEEGTTPGGKPLKKSGTVRFGGWSRASGARRPPPPRRPPPRSHPRTRARRSRSSPTCTAIASGEEQGSGAATPALRRTRIEIEL